MISKFNCYAFLFPLLLLAIVLIHSCKSIEPVTISRIQSVSVSDFGTDGASFKISMGIKNPNNLKFKVKEGDLDLFLNEWQLGKVKMKDKIIIPKKSDNIYTVDVKADFSNLSFTAIPGILNMIKNKRAEVGMKGHINVKTFIVRKKFPVDLKEKVDLEKYLPK